MYPAPSTALANFSIMMECTPESGGCDSVCEIRTNHFVKYFGFRSVPSFGIGSSAELGMSTFFRGITETVPSLFRGIFPERNSVPNHIHKAYLILESVVHARFFAVVRIVQIRSACSVETIHVLYTRSFPKKLRIGEIKLYCGYGSGKSLKITQVWFSKVKSYCKYLF